MVLSVKKIRLIVAIICIGIFAILVLLQFTRAMAADVQKAINTKPVNAPHQADPVTLGIDQLVFIANNTQSNFGILTPDGITYTDLLSGQLGSVGGGRFDFVLTPDGKTAAVSNFGDSAVYFIDISNPIVPSLITSVTTPMFAEDMDISADGKYLLVTDGGFSPYLVSIDIVSATIVDVLTDSLGIGLSFQAVDIAPDNTVVTIDYFNGRVNTLLLDAAGQLTYANNYTITYPLAEGGDPENAVGRPINVSVAPDGQTILVNDAHTSTMPIYQIITPGVLTFTNFITGLHGTFPEGAENPSAGSQSVAFNANGDKAYVHVNTFMYFIGPYEHYTGTLAVLDINGPGQVSLEAGGLLTVPRSTTSSLFGVDTMAVANNKLYISCPTISGCFNANKMTTSLYVVDLADYSISETYVRPYTDYDDINVPAGVVALPVQLKLNKTVSSPSAKPGEPITFTISFTNTGVISATNVLLTDDLGDFITDTSYTSEGVELTQEPGSRYIWHAADLGHNAGATITITGILAKPLAPGIYTNTANLSGSWVLKTTSITLEVEQAAPVADAGPDQSIMPGTEVTLDGSGSSDPNGDAIIAYQWTQTGGEPITLSGADTVNPTFTTPFNGGTFTFTLVVTDSVGLASLPDEVVVYAHGLFLPIILANPSP